MSRILLLMSHIGSGSDHLFKTLTQNPTIDGFKTEIVYDHPESFKTLKSNLHKRDNSVSIWMDELLHNYRLTSHTLGRYCKMVFLFGEPRSSIETICRTYQPEEGLMYYRFRLQGMLEYIARTPGCLILTWPRLQKEGVQVLERYLELWEPIDSLNAPPDKEKERLSFDILKEAEDIYNRLLYQLKTLEKRAERS